MDFFTPTRWFRDCIPVLILGTSDAGARDKDDGANQGMLGGLVGGDVYESISDEELDLFDEIEEENSQLPKPASVMDVDWSLLSNINKQPKSAGTVP